MPDKVISVRGQVIHLSNRINNRTCVLLWRSKKLTRKVVSSLAGETHAVVAAVGDMVYTRAMLEKSRTGR